MLRALLQRSAPQKAAASLATCSVRIGSGTTCRYMSEGGDRLHSTDIAFKPAESGWGGGSSKYSNNFDKIFGGGGKKTDEKKDDERPAAENGSSSSGSGNDKQR